MSHNKSPRDDVNDRELQRTAYFSFANARIATAFAGTWFRSKHSLPAGERCRVEGARFRGQRLERHHGNYAECRRRHHAPSCTSQAPG